MASYGNITAYTVSAYILFKHEIGGTDIDLAIAIHDVFWILA